MATNKQVVTAWLNGKVLKSGNGNLSSTGDNLLSYELVIGRTLSDGTKQVYIEPNSVTTTKHMSLARAAVPTDCVIANINGGGHTRGNYFPQIPGEYVITLWHSSWLTYAGAFKNLQEGEHVRLAHGRYYRARVLHISPTLKPVV